MALEEKNISIRSTNCTYGTAGGTGAILHVGEMITADTAATVEAASYFNALATGGRIPDGGIVILRAVVGVGGTVKMKNYRLTRSGATVTAALLDTTAG